MRSLWVDQGFTYDGSQLRSLFAYSQFRLSGDSIVSWRGPCAVAAANIVDFEDKLNNQTIAGADMVHFILEIFQQNLVAAVALQRLMAAIVLDYCRQTSTTEMNAKLFRDGDDIWFNDQKLSISVATVSPVSALIHFAVNVSNRGTPVKTLSLEDLQIDSSLFAKTIMKRFCDEYLDLIAASQKVAWVR